MPFPKDIKKVKKPLIRQEVYATLHKWIIDGVVKAGERVQDKDLAEALSVSRTPVREALQRLEDEGLVETAANRWTRVATVDISEAERIYPIIWSLESLAMSLLEQRIDSVTIEEMARANNRLERALNDRNGLEASKADRDFHHAFVLQSNNPELIKILQELKVKLRRLEIEYFGGCIVATKSVEEHKIIISALKAHDYLRAAETVEANWKESLTRIRRHSTIIETRENNNVANDEYAFPETHPGILGRL